MYDLSLSQHNPVPRDLQLEQVSEYKSHADDKYELSSMWNNMLSTWHMV